MKRPLPSDCLPDLIFWRRNGGPLPLRLVRCLGIDAKTGDYEFSCRTVLGDDPSHNVAWADILVPVEEAPK